MNENNPGISVSVDAEVDRLDQKMEDSARIVEGTTERMDKATKRASDQFKRLEASVDPLARATLRYERDSDKVRIALEKGVVTADRAAKVQATLTQRYEATRARLATMTAATDTYTRATTRAATANRNMGFAVQNVGFQIGDFATQVASGQGVLRPFIQQGTQMVSMFGPIGAVAGAAGATIGALAVSLTAGSEAADVAENSYSILTAAISDYNDETGRATNLTEARTLALLDTAKALNIQAQAEITSLESEARVAEADLARLREELKATEASGLEGTSGLGSSGSQLRADIAEREEALKTLTDQVAELGGQLDVSAEDIERFEKRLQDIASGADDAAKELERQAKAAERAAKAADAAFASQIRRLEGTIEAQRAEVEGRREQIPLIEAETALRERMGRELLPEERDQLHQLIETREALTTVIEEQERVEAEATKASEKAAKEYARVWRRAGDEVADSFADALFEGEDFFDSLLSAGRRAAAEMASLVLRPVVSPIFSGVAAGGASGGISVPGIGGGQIGGQGSGGSDLFGSLGNLGNVFSGGGLGSLTFNAGAGNLGVDIAQFIGAGAETQALFGNALGNLGSTAGIAGSFGGNLLANALLGDRGIGANIGGTLGAIGGSFIPVPFVGPAIGAFIGNAIGGLFGNSNESVGPVIGGTFGREGQVLSIGTDNEGSRSAAQDFSDAVSETFEQILDLTGGRFTENVGIENSQRNGFMTGTIKNGRAVSLTTGSDLIGAIQFGLGDNITGGDANVIRTLQASSATGEDFEQLFSDLALASLVSSLQSANDNISPLQQAIDGVTEAYAEQTDQARKLGLSTNELNQERDKEIQALRDAVAAEAAAFNDNLTVREMALAGNDRGILSLSLEANRTSQLDAAQQLVDAQIVSIDAFNRLSSILDREVAKSLADFDTALAETSQTAAVSRAQAELGVLQTVGGAVSSIDDFLFQQSIGDTSSLTGAQKLSVAQTRFDSLLGDVRGGDLESIGGLTQAAQSLLTIGRDQFASSEPFVNLENSIVTTLKNLQASITSEQNVGALIADVMKSLDEAQQTRNDALIASLEEQIGELRQEFTQLNIKLAAA